MYSVFFFFFVLQQVDNTSLEEGYVKVVMCYVYTPLCILEIPGQPLEDDKCLNDKLKVFAI